MIIFQSCAHGHKNEDNKLAVKPTAIFLSQPGGLVQVYTLLEMNAFGRAQSMVSNSLIRRFLLRMKTISRSGVGREGMGLPAEEAQVGHLDSPLVLDSVHDGGEPALRGGDGLEEDSPPHVLTLPEEIIQGQGLQEPLSDVIPLEVLAVGKVVP